MSGPRGITVGSDSAIAVADFGAETTPAAEIVILGADGPDAGARASTIELAVADPDVDTINEAGETALRPTIVWADPWGDLWFSSSTSNVVGRVADPGTPGERTQIIRNGPSTEVGPAVLDAPFTFAADEDGYVWFVNHDSDSLGVIDPTVLSGAPDVIDCSTESCPVSLVSLPEILDEPVGVVLGPSVVGGRGRDLWIMNWGTSNSIAVVDPAMRVAAAEDQPSLAGIAIDFNESNPPLLLDADQTADTRSGPRAAAFVTSSGGSHDDLAWIVHHDSNSLARINLESCDDLPCEIAERGVIVGAEHPTAIAWDGGWADSAQPPGTGSLYFTNRTAGWIGQLAIDDNGEWSVRRLSFAATCADALGGSGIIADSAGVVWFTSYECRIVGRIEPAG